MNATNRDQVVRPMSGSFVRARKPHDGFRSFQEALVYNYATYTPIDEIHIGVKRVEILGFEKLQRIQSELDKLQVASLSRSLVSTVDEVPNLTLNELDLSFNLFESFDHVVRLLRQVQLDKLNLTGNRFTHWSAIEPLHLRSLNLTMTYPGDLLLHIPSLFPKLQELSLCDNLLLEVPEQTRSMSLETLDLSMNALTRMPLVSSKNVNVSYNNIQDIGPIQQIEKLDIRYNNVTWDLIDSIASRLPQLRDLRVNGLAGQLEEVEYEIIARIPQITQLNGVKINDRENAELWWLSKAFSEGTNTARVQQLSIRYGRSSVPQQDKMWSLNVIHGDRVIPLRLPQIDTFRLKSLLCRLFGKCGTEINLWYCIGKSLHRCNELSLVNNYTEIHVT